MVLILLIFAVYSLHLLVAAVEQDTIDRGLTQEQRAEVMSRQTEFDRAQNIDLADRVLAARVERSWRCYANDKY
jgi:hypothetical protein